VRDVRERAKRQEEFYRRQGEVQSCVVCGRLFCRRKDKVCSMACKEKAAERDKKSAWRGD
jgi:hypothetical protein